MDKTIQNSGFVKKELSLLRSFIKEPWREFTITEIKKIAKKKSHHYVFEALKKFCFLEVLKEKKAGNTNTYSVDYESEKSIQLISFVEYIMRDERTEIPYVNLAKIAKNIKSPFYSFLITGSYAEKKQKPNSDIDIVIIIPNSESKKDFQTALREGELMHPEIHGFVFTQDDFYQMLTNSEFNYGKEAARKHIIFYGAEQYYKILFEAMKHGFKS